jgi:predicted thioredoxin/glutaredoxin
MLKGVIKKINFLEGKSNKKLDKGINQNSLILKVVNDYLPIILYYNFEPILDEEYFCKI